MKFEELVARVAELADPEWSIVYDRNGNPIMVVTESASVTGRTLARGWGFASIAIIRAGGPSPAGDAWILKCHVAGADPDDPPYQVLTVPPADTDAWAARHLPPQRREATLDPRVEQIRAMALVVELYRLFDDDSTSGCRRAERVLECKHSDVMELMAVAVALRAAPKGHATADSLRARVVLELNARLHAEGAPLANRSAVTAALTPSFRP